MDPSEIPLTSEDVQQETQRMQAERHLSTGRFNSFSEAVSGTIQLLRTRSGMGRLPHTSANEGDENTPVEGGAHGDGLAEKPFDALESLSAKLKKKLAIKQQKANILELKNDQTKQYRTQSLRELFQYIQDEIHNIEEFTKMKPGAEIEGAAKRRHKYSGGWLTQRDLRRLESVYAPQEEPVLIVRRHCILFSFDMLRGIILWDRIIVLVPDGADSLLLFLEQNLFQNDEQISSAARVMPKENEKRPSHGFLEGVLQLAKTHRTNKDSIEEKHTFVELDEHTRNSKNASANVTLTDPMPLRSKSFADLKSLMAQNESPALSLMNKDPFEMQALEAVLNTVVEMQSNAHEHLHTQVQRQLRILSGSVSVSIENQEALRNLKNVASAQEVRVRRCTTVLEEMLEEDEDMALMNLTKLRRDPKLYAWPLSYEILSHHGEVELLLEAYLTDYNSALNKLQVLGTQIHNFEESVSLRLDNVRNQFLLAGTIFALLSTWFTFGALIAGIFGQNLYDHLEDDPFYFNLITSVTAGVIVLAVGVGLWILLRLWTKGALVGSM